MIKKVLSIGIFLVLFSCSFFNVSAANIPDPPKDVYFADFAGILSEELKSFILASGSKLYEETSAQISVVTTSSLDGMDIKDYGLELGRKWGIGSKEKNNGLVIVLAPNERKINVSVGTGLEGKIPDSKAGRFIDEYAKSDLKLGNWDNGIRNLYSALLSEVYSEYGKTLPENIIKSNRSRRQGRRSSSGFLFGVIILLLLLFFPRRGKFLFLSLFGRSFFRGSGGFGGSSSSGGSGSSGGGGGFSGGGSSRGF